MKLLFGLGTRRQQPEVMDQADLDAELHAQALCGLERINRWSGSAGIVWPAIRQAAQAALAAGRRPLRVLDLATGAGDVPLRVWRWAQRAGVPLCIEGCDRSPHAVAHARNRAEEAGAAVRFFTHDVLAGPLPDSYDVLLCSLFLHHLGDDEAVSLLARMANAARRLVLVSDLRRGTSGMLLAYAGTRVLTASPVVHTDGPLSVAAAFTCPEVSELARRAGLANAVVRRRWPYRLMLSLERS